MFKLLYLLIIIQNLISILKLYIFQVFRMNFIVKKNKYNLLVQNYRVSSVLPQPENDYFNIQVKFPFLPPKKEGRFPFFQGKEGSDYIKNNVRKDVGEGGKSDSGWC